MRKMEVVLDKRENRKLIEIHKTPLNLCVIAMKPEKLALMLFSAHIYGITRITAFQQLLSLYI